MKWSSTAAAILMLAVSAPASAQVFGRYQSITHEAPVIEGPVVAAPDQTPASMSVLRARSNNELESIDAPTQMSGYGGYGSTGYGGSMSYGGIQGLVPGGGCCLGRDPKADTLWTGYCSGDHMGGWPRGWLAGRLNCGSCGSCCTLPSRPLFSGWKHCGKAFAPACGCAQAAPACDCAAPACTSCGPAPCGCGCPKAGGLLVSLFASFQHKHGCGCTVDSCSSCAGVAGDEWTPSEEYQFNSGDEEVIEPALPEAPVPTSDEAADAPAAKSARGGLLPDRLRQLLGITS